MKNSPGSGGILVIVPEIKRNEKEVVETVSRHVRAVPGAVLRTSGSVTETQGIIRDAALSGVVRIIAVGGDGTLHTLVNACCSLPPGAKTSFGIIPAGTGNDFAGSAGIPLDDTAAALDIAFNADPAPVDVGRVNDRCFLNIMSGGFGSRVTTELSREMKDRFGGYAYLLSGVRHIRDLEPRFGRLKAPGFEWEGTMYGFAVCNGRTAGGGILISPDAVIDDGLFNLVVFPEMPLTDLASVLKSLLLERALAEGGKIIVRRIDSLELELTYGWRVSLDGEPYAGERHSVRILPRRFSICLPENSKLLAHTANRVACPRATP